MFSALHPITDFAKMLRHFRFVPTSELMHRSKVKPRSVASSVIASRPDAIKAARAASCSFGHSGEAKAFL